MNRKAVVTKGMNLERVNKRIVTFVAMLFIAFINVCAAPVIKDGYYQITNKEDMLWLVNNFSTIKDKNIRLVNDIDMGNTTWAGLGSGNSDSFYAISYSGIFDGNGKTISNIVINNSTNYIGLFNSVKGATIKDFTITGRINADNNTTAKIGSVVAQVWSSSTISNVTSSVNINTGNCKEGARVGGLVGYMDNGTIKDCTYNGNITCTGFKEVHCGGICASAKSGKITHCTFEGSINESVNGNKNNVCLGGILGTTEGGQDITITHNYAVGTVKFDASSKNHIPNEGGMIVGRINISDSTKTAIIDGNSYNSTSNGVTGGYGVVSGTIKDENGNIINASTLQNENSSNKKIVFIRTVDEFNSFATQVNSSSNITFIAELKNDIDFSGKTITTIGKSSNKFKGEFNGNNYSIKNVKIETSASVAGLFNYVEGNSFIGNFNISGSITSNSNSNSVVGVIANITLDNSQTTTIENINSSLDITTPKAFNNTSYIGGIVGNAERIQNKNNTTLVVSKCIFCGTINNNKGNGYIGGLIGRIYTNNSDVKNCLMTGTISSNSTDDYGVRIGGIIGDVEDNNNFRGLSQSLMYGSIITEQRESYCNYALIGENCQNIDGQNNNYNSNHNYAAPVAIKGKSGQKSINDLKNAHLYMSQSDVMSGRACALLNKSGNIWGQVLGNDTESMEYPVPGNTAYVTVDGNNNYTASRIVLNSNGKLSISIPSDASGTPRRIVAKHLEITFNYFGDENWQSTFLPVRLSEETWSSYFTVAKIMNFHSFVKRATNKKYTYLEYEEVKSGRLYDNHPYLFRKVSENAFEEPLKLIFDEADGSTIDDRSVYSSSNCRAFDCATTESKYSFIGNYVNSPEITVDNYTLSNGNLDLSTNADTYLARGISRSNIQAFQWYITLSNRGGSVMNSTSEAPARIYLRNPYGGEDEEPNEEVEENEKANEATAIDYNETTDDENANGIFSLDGTSLSECKQGLNIIRYNKNSKKVYNK